MPKDLVNALILFVSANIFASPCALAAEKNHSVSVAGYEIPGVMEPKLGGSYDKILNEVFRRIPQHQVNYFVIPTARAESLFAEHQVDCIAPMDKRYSTYKGQMLNSKPLNVAKIYIYSRPGEGPWSTLNEIKNKKIGIKNGLWYGPKWNDAKLTAEAVSTDEQNVEKLKRHRIDAFLAYVPDMTILHLERGLALPNFDPKKPFDIHNDSLLCHKTEANTKFLKDFDVEISNLSSKGWIKEQLGTSFVP